MFTEKEKDYLLELLKDQFIQVGKKEPVKAMMIDSIYRKVEASLPNAVRKSKSLPLPERRFN